MIDLEKQDVDGDFSNLLLNSYIAVPSNHYKNKINFWIAKVEKVVEQDEKNVLKVIKFYGMLSKKSESLKRKISSKNH
jgi:G:T-mismatch repair DNA endonuclease (very short patch repair protein)